MSVPDGYIRVAKASDIVEKRGKRVKVGDEEIALWKVDGMLYAIGNVCPHQHVPALHTGVLDGTAVSCPMHGWTFSLETGREEEGNGRVKTYRVLLDGESVYIEQPKPSW